VKKTAYTFVEQNNHDDITTRITRKINNDNIGLMVIRVHT